MSREEIFLAAAPIVVEIEEGPIIADTQITAVERNGCRIDVSTPELTGKQNKAFVLAANGVDAYTISLFLGRGPAEIDALVDSAVSGLRAHNLEQAITLSFGDGTFSSSDSPQENIKFQPRETEILQHIAAGNDLNTIVAFTGLTREAIHKSYNIIFNKLGALSTREATVLGYTYQLIKPKDAAIFQPIETTVLNHTPLVRTKHHKPLEKDIPVQFFLRGGLVAIENPLSLTAYEQRIFFLKSLGLDSKTVSKVLDIAHSSALDALHLYEKFDAHNIQGAITAAFSNGTYSLVKPIKEELFRPSDRPSVTLLAKGILANDAIPIVGSGANLRGKSRTLFHGRTGAPNAAGTVTLAHMTTFLNPNIWGHPLPYVVATDVAPASYVVLDDKKGLEVPGDWLNDPHASMLNQARWHGELITNTGYPELTDRENTIRFLRSLGVNFDVVKKIMKVSNWTVEHDDDAALELLNVGDRFAATTVSFSDKTYFADYKGARPELRKISYRDLQYLELIASGVGGQIAADAFDLNKSNVDAARARLKEITGGTNLRSSLMGAFVRKLLDPNKIAIQYTTEG